MEIIPNSEGRNQKSSIVIWETLNPSDTTPIPRSDKELNPKFTPPINFEEAKDLINSIPIQSKDFKPLLNISHVVPTASALGKETALNFTPSHLKSATGTGNQNYAIQLDYGLSDTLQISGFYSEADDPLNAKINSLDARPGNFWEIFGAAVRWNFFTKRSFIALNSSFESWTVGSGGSDSFGKNSSDYASPNIFNDSGKRGNTKLY